MDSSFTDTVNSLKPHSHSKDINFLCRSRFDKSTTPPGLPLPLFRGVIINFARGFSLGYADAIREVRPAQNRLANFPLPKSGKIATVTNSSQIGKCLIPIL